MRASTCLALLAVTLTALGPSDGTAQFRWFVAIAADDSARYLPVVVELYRGSGRVRLSAATLQDTLSARLRAAGYRLIDHGDTPPHGILDRAILRFDFWPEGGTRGELYIACPRAHRGGFSRGPDRAFIGEEQLAGWFDSLIPAPIDRRAGARR